MLLSSVRNTQEQVARGVDEDKKRGKDDHVEVEMCVGGLEGTKP
jgi:hypothetical protein